MQLEVKVKKQSEKKKLPLTTMEEYTSFVTVAKANKKYILIREKKKIKKQDNSNFNNITEYSDHKGNVQHRHETSLEIQKLKNANTYSIEKARGFFYTLLDKRDKSREIQMKVKIIRR